MKPIWRPSQVLLTPLFSPLFANALFYLLSATHLATSATNQQLLVK